MSTKKLLNATLDSKENSKAKGSTIKYYALQFLFNLVLVTILTICYVEIGHDKGWFRAERWYTCLHTHQHFFWQ